jgi:phosphoglycolate phosphatase-like HAD superfamily hydrolase
MTNNLADLVFDLDGTLVDSAPDLHAALNRLMESLGRRRLELTEVILMVGDGVLSPACRKPCKNSLAEAIAWRSAQTSPKPRRMPSSTPWEWQNSSPQ